MVGYPSGANVLLPASALVDVLRPVVHGKGSSRDAVGQHISDCASAGANADRANVALAEFRHVGAKSRLFFTLNPKRTQNATNFFADVARIL